jgi:DNA-binding NarL/FixJ family response regulator
LGAGEPISVLLVDDYQPYRDFIAGLLNRERDFCLAGQACDGLEAIAKAQQLRPDVVLMDLSLPGLNGFESARRILELLPLTKILFLTGEGDFDIVQEAMHLGAAGYILKINARSELLPKLAALNQRGPAPAKDPYAI